MQPGEMVFHKQMLNISKQKTYLDYSPKLIGDNGGFNTSNLMSENLRKLNFGN